MIIGKQRIVFSRCIQLLLDMLPLAWSESELCFVYILTLPAVTIGIVDQRNETKLPLIIYLTRVMCIHTKK